jgi:hypothetical protein
LKFSLEVASRDLQLVPKVLLILVFITFYSYTESFEFFVPLSQLGFQLFKFPQLESQLFHFAVVIGSRSFGTAQLSLQLTNFKMQLLLLLHPFFTLIRTASSLVRKIFSQSIILANLSANLYKLLFYFFLFGADNMILIQ